MFTIVRENQWQKVYPDVDRGVTKFHSVLTGYLNEDTVQRIGELARESGARDIAIRYRAWKGSFWLGGHTLLKWQIAEKVDAAAKPLGVKTDISVRPEDTLLADDWFRFLLHCKYTIGVEAGASILDYDGSVRERTEKYQSERPAAQFDEIKPHCFPGRHGELELKAISRRHLEAADEDLPDSDRR